MRVCSDQNLRLLSNRKKPNITQSTNIKMKNLRAKDAAERVKEVVAHLRTAQVQHHLVAPELTGPARHVQTPVRVRGVQHLQW